MREVIFRRARGDQRRLNGSVLTARHPASHHGRPARPTGAGFRRRAHGSGLTSADRPARNHLTDHSPGMIDPIRVRADEGRAWQSAGPHSVDDRSAEPRYSPEFSIL
jgi:hypothetical protein